RKLADQYNLNELQEHSYSALGITDDIKTECSSEIRVTEQVDFTNQNEPYLDATFVIGGEKVYASKQILAFHSPVFKSIFYGESAEENNQEIDLPDVNREEFIELLHNINPSSKNITDESVQFLLKLRHLFQIECVIDRAEDFLIESRNISKKKKLIIADDYKLFALQEHCFSAFKGTKELYYFKTTSIYKSLSDKMKIDLLERNLEAVYRHF
ncbi:hypothetical protein PMAYCL1PPCAC_25249, partial [Pristionchus mayeri]